MIIKTCAYPRAALIGNPSDGYYGKTIAFTFDNFQTSITLYETGELEILPGKRDHVLFDSLEALYYDVKQFGYYGGFRLIKAAIKKFHEYCINRGIRNAKKNFTIRYYSSIPLHLGLAGSSAIITACMRALLEFYTVDIEPADLANLVLSVETEELGISAGLQDRVAQVYQGLVYMDFDKGYMEKNGKGRYERLVLRELPLYIAFKTSLSESSEILHNNLRFRYNNGDSDVIAAMRRFAGYTDEFRNAYEQGDLKTINRLINANFDLRKSVCAISADNDDMIETARRCGVSAKFTGSGGAIIGLYNDEDRFRNLVQVFAEKNIAVIRPNIV
ncbi:MAG: hypothetical protein JW874_15740 [Spirochaetales bacterium]|nr:hypothetical protein [Spirochaetales bacterium]